MFNHSENQWGDQMPLDSVQAILTEDLNMRCVSAKVCPTHPQRWSGWSMCPHFSWVVWPVHLRSDTYRKWSRVMSLGCTDTTWKQGHKAPNGKHPHQHQNRHVSWNHMWRSCWLLSFTWKELFILYLFPEDKWLIQQFTKKSCNIWERPSGSDNEPLSFQCAYLHQCSK